MTNRLWLTGLAVALVLVLAVAGIGTWQAHAQGPGGNNTPPCGQYYGPGMMHGPMMGGWNAPENCPFADNGWAGRGPARGRGMAGMMGGWYTPEDHPFAGDGWAGRGFGAGMMGAWSPPAELAPAGATLSLDEAVAVAQAYIATWEDPNLVLGEVMQFDNHFYADAMEAASGRGAFEFLIDPVSGAVTLEPGPNMMWNLRYGMHSGWGQAVTRWSRPAGSDGVEMTVSVEAARAAAQAYLDANYPGLTVDEEAEAFYGYYTLHILEDEQVAGMLSVNGETGDVWLHHWHGDFMSMSGFEV